MISRRINLVSLLLILFGLLAGRQNVFAVNHSNPNWVSLWQWAKANDFKLIEDGQALTLSNRSERLTFKINSPLAAISNVNVWLGDPITLKNGQPCITALDLNTSIEPILSPQTNHVGDIHTICLDPGHGGKDTGGVVGSYLEKHYTLPLAEELAALLEAKGFKVLLTRTNDTFIELENRPALADRQQADLFISLHFNIGPPEAKGVEVYCLTPAGEKSTNESRWGHLEGWSNNTSPQPGNHWDDQNILLAYQLQKSLVETLSANDRGLRRARFAVLRTAAMPAVLIEGGFLSDSKDREKIASLEYRNRLAAAIVKGVLNYQHSLENLQPQKKQI